MRTTQRPHLRLRVGALLAFLTSAACSSSSPSAAGTPDAATESDSRTPRPDAHTVDGRTKESGTTPNVDARVEGGGCDIGGGNECTMVAACAATVNGACLVTTLAGSGTAPSFMGGPIADGIYYLTASTAYGPPDGTAGQTQRITMTFSGGAVGIVQDSDANCTNAPSATGTFSASDNQLILSLACPLADSVVVDYTATPTTFTYGGTPSGTSSQVFTFERQ
jgi:hypothetical protein